MSRNHDVQVSYSTEPSPTGAGDERLMHAERDREGHWTLSTVDTPGHVVDSDVAIDDAGAASIAYVLAESLTRVLRFAHRSPSARWVVDDLAVEVDVRRLLGDRYVAAEPSGRVHVVYSVHGELHHLEHTTCW